MNPIFIILIALFLFVNCNNGETQNDKQNQKSATSEEITQSNPEISLKEFHDAAFNGDLLIVKTAIENGIQVNLVDGRGQNALMLAAFNGHTDLVKLLIEHKVPINVKDSTGRTALIFASTGPFPKTVQLLIDNKAEIDIVDNVEHFTALMFAASEGQLEIVEILLKAGANSSLKDIDGDNAEAFARQKGHIAVADYIKDYTQ